MHVINEFFIICIPGVPLIVGGPQDQFEVNNGSSALFSCVTLAFPQHTITWSFTTSNNSTVDINNSPKYSINNVRNGSSFGELTVYNVSFEDRGTYRCAATNTIGSEDQEANLTVHGESYILNLTVIQSKV